MSKVSEILAKYGYENVREGSDDDDVNPDLHKKEAIMRELSYAIKKIPGVENVESISKRGQTSFSFTFKGVTFEVQRF